ncbi:MAG TPA: hypothetical protein PLZ51_18285 [Aggregatilineales bacterium]|nr:hypothetical protein [Aggregatilineales bacterium]
MMVITFNLIYFPHSSTIKHEEKHTFPVDNALSIFLRGDVGAQYIAPLRVR